MPDPEIPVVSVVDLGLVHTVELDGDRLRVELLPPSSAARPWS